MIATLVAAALGALLLGGCGAQRLDQRSLPVDRTTPVVYVALGDSTVEGAGASRPQATYVARIHERLQAVYPGATMTNLGVGGATSTDVRAGQLARAVELAPDLVTLSVGPNDVTTRVPRAAFEANVVAILAGLTARTRAVVVVSLLPDLAITPRFRDHPAQDVIGRLTVEFNDVLRRLGHQHAAIVVDLYDPSRQEVPARPELVADDGYHPSDVGHARWAELMWQGLQPRIAACRATSEAWTVC